MAPVGKCYYTLILAWRLYCSESVQALDQPLICLLITYDIGLGMAVEAVLVISELLDCDLAHHL